MRVAQRAPLALFLSFSNDQDLLFVQAQMRSRWMRDDQRRPLANAWAVVFGPTKVRETRLRRTPRKKCWIFPNSQSRSWACGEQNVQIVSFRCWREDTTNFSKQWVLFLAKKSEPKTRRARHITSHIPRERHWSCPSFTNNKRASLSSPFLSYHHHEVVNA